MNAMLVSPNSGAYNPQVPQPGQGTKIAGRPDFDLTHPDDWPQWLKNCHTENAAVQVTKEGKVIWVAGTMHDGIWMDGLWMGGRWRDGIWLGGDFYEGVWCAGEFRGGIFHSWVWKDGVFRNGIFRGLWMGGVWEHGDFQGYWQRTRTPPRYRIDFEEWEK
jgi:hypothetical protein